MRACARVRVGSTSPSRTGAIKVLIGAVDTSSLSESWSESQLTSEPPGAIWTPRSVSVPRTVELPGLFRYLPADPKLVPRVSAVVMAVAEAMMPVLTSFPSPFEGKPFENVSD